MAPSRRHTMATDTTYTLSMEDVPAKGRSRRHRRGSSSNHHKNEEEDPSDGSASLTYSAGSSVASSAAGESTDSSFADIMRVLDVQDSQELAAFMKREGVTDPTKFAVGAKSKASTISVASSLNYSTDGESALEGAHLLQTITGQPSDSHGPDGGGFGDLGDVLFAPADQMPEKVKRKGSKRTSPKSRGKGHKRSKSGGSSSRRSSRGSSDDGERLQEPSTPPPVPRNKSRTKEEEDEDEVWYAKWWMCGFADSFRDLVPKR